MAEDTKFPSRVVVDASLILSLLLPDEKRKEPAKKIINAYRENKISFFTPQLLKFEVTNGLIMATKRHRVNQAMARKLLKIFEKLEIDYREVKLDNTLNLALKNNLSAYDAAYLALSLQLKLPLLTLDRKLSKLAN